MNKIMNGLFALLVASLIGVPAGYPADTERAQDKAGMPPPEGGREKERRPIPQAAIDACTGKKKGASCSDGRITGACDYTPDKKYFACKPQGPPPGQRNSKSGLPPDQNAK